jgi:medium-chain acyl-[acyl-carrier-protein] hydrolase
MLTSSRWVLRPRPLAEPRLRLFCFPYAGAGTSALRQFSLELPSDIEPCIVELPGRETRFTEAPFARVVDLIRAAARAMHPLMDDAPFALFGHSMGALLGFELARELRRRGGPKPVYLIVSGALAPHLPHPDPPTHRLSDPEFIEEVRRRYDGIPAAVLEHPELVKIILPTLRADVRSLETYVYRDEAPLDCPILALGGLEDSRVGSEELGAWRLHTRAPFSMKRFPGNHFFVQTAQEAVLQEIGNVLGEARASLAVTGQ